MRAIRKAIVLAVVVAATGGTTGAAAQDDELCGLGVPPGAPGWRAAEAHKRDEIRRTGFLRVCEANLERFATPGGLRPLASVLPELAFKPVELAATPFARLQGLGAKGERKLDQGKVSQLYRSFRAENGHVLTLLEHDMSVDGIHMVLLDEDELVRINGLPARLVVQQARSGRAVSVLVWKEGRRSYELRIDANVALEKNLRPQLFALASALPKSVPANSNEPPDEPFSIGPDGLPRSNPPPERIVCTPDGCKPMPGPPRS